MWRDALLVAGRDLRLELRSRVAINQVAPFAVLVLVLFAFALDTEGDVLERTAPGLFWVAVVLSALLAIQRSAGLDAPDGVRDALRLSGLDPAGVFLGKVAAVAVQLAALELLLGAGVVLLYGVELDGLGTLVPVAITATVGVAAAGTLYGVLAAGIRVRETLLPLLLLPVVAPVLIAATRASEAALEGVTPDVAPADWLRLLVVFAVIYVAFGVVAYGPLLEES
jgi:heme exporter protein B